MGVQTYYFRLFKLLEPHPAIKIDLSQTRGLQLGRYKLVFFFICATFDENANTFISFLSRGFIDSMLVQFCDMSKTLH